MLLGASRGRTSVTTSEPATSGGTRVDRSTARSSSRDIYDQSILGAEPPGAYSVNAAYWRSHPHHPPHGTVWRHWSSVVLAIAFAFPLTVAAIGLPHLLQSGSPIDLRRNTAQLRPVRSGAQPGRRSPPSWTRRRRPRCWRRCD